MRFLFEWTAEDVANGVPDDPQSCPPAVALDRQTGGCWEVYPLYAKRHILDATGPRRERYDAVIWWPEGFARRICAYDATGMMEPGSAEVEVQELYRPD